MKSDSRLKGIIDDLVAHSYDKHRTAGHHFELMVKAKSDEKFVEQAEEFLHKARAQPKSEKDMVLRRLRDHVNSIKKSKLKKEAPAHAEGKKEKRIFGAKKVKE